METKKRKLDVKTQSETDLCFEIRDSLLNIIIKKPNDIDKKFLLGNGFHIENNNIFFKIYNNDIKFVADLLLKLKLPAFNPLFYKLIDLAYNEINEVKAKEEEEPDIILKDFIIKLHPHQQIAVKKIAKHHKFILGDDYGVGKTASALASIINYGKNRNLIICPKSLAPNWIAEFEKCIPCFKPIFISKTKKAEKQLTNLNFDQPCFVIIAYSLLNNILKLMKKLKFMDWDFIIADESHFVKHAKSQRSKAFKQISKTSKLLQLSATVSHKTCDLWNLLRLCNDEIFAEFASPFSPKTFIIPKPSPKSFRFADRYTNMKVIRSSGGRLVYDYKAPKRLAELNALTKPFILRRLLNDVADLPPLIEETIVIGSLPKNVEKKFKDQILKMEGIKETKGKQAADVLLMELMRETSKLKEPIVLEYLLDFVKSYKQKILVFFYHKAFGDFLEDGLNKAQIGNVKVHSDIKVEDRQALFDQFIDLNSNIQIGLFSLGCASTGLNFTCANICMYADMSFDVIGISQSKGRCYRITQTKKVILQFLELSGSTDGMLIKTINSQERTAKTVLDL